MNSKDNFFDMFKDSLEGYSPEVSESVYAGIRSKMRWNNFFKFSVTSLNLWTLLAIGIVGVSLYSSNTADDFAQAKSMDQSLTKNTTIYRAIATYKPQEIEKKSAVSNTKEIVTQTVVNHTTKNTKIKSSINNNLATSIKNTGNRHKQTNIENAPTNPSLKTSKENSENVNITPASIDKSKNTTICTTSQTVNKELEETSNNKFFTGKNRLSDFQTQRTGLNEELKKTNDKKFTIKVKVPKN